MDAGQLVVDIILGQHDAADPAEVLRFIPLHPQKLRGGESGERDIGGQRRQALFADGVVEVFHLPEGTAVVPQDGRSDHLIRFVQRHQAVHLAASADARHLFGVKAPQKRRDALPHRLPPVGRLLFRPAGLGEQQRILPCDGTQHRPLPIHQQQLQRGSAKVNADEIHALTTFRMISFRNRGCVSPAGYGIILSGGIRPHLMKRR